MTGPVTGGIVSVEAFPRGLRCGECDRMLSTGEPYAERLVDVRVDEMVVGGGLTEWVLLVCEGCAS